MTELELIFLFGPLHFFPWLLAVGGIESVDILAFVISGLGTVFWTVIIIKIIDERGETISLGQSTTVSLDSPPNSV